MKILLPYLCRTLAYVLPLGDICPYGFYRTIPSSCQHVVIAIYEKLLRMFTSHSAILGEDPVPCLGNHFQLWLQPLVRHVASYDYSVHLLRTEILQGVYEGLCRLLATDVNVAENAYHEGRFSQSEDVLSTHWHTSASCSCQKC